MVQWLRENMAEAIHLHFQPIVAISHPLAPTVAVEALARWDDAVLGQVPPAEFVDVCERNGLIGELGAVVLDKTLRQLEQWVQIGTPLQATINVSWLQLRDDACMLRMQETIAGQPHLARWLVIEVTEGVLADDDEAVAYLQELRNLGVILAIDDFGTGASTLTRLRHLPVDVLKIDRMLLQGIGEDPGADSVLSLVQQLGNSLGLAVVVEGVETHEARNRLVELGFELAQGFYFNRPLPAHQVPLSNGVDPMLNRRELPLPTQS